MKALHAQWEQEAREMIQKKRSFIDTLSTDVIGTIADKLGEDGKKVASVTESLKKELDSEQERAVKYVTCERIIHEASKTLLTAEEMAFIKSDVVKEIAHSNTTPRTTVTVLILSNGQEFPYAHSIKREFLPTDDYELAELQGTALATCMKNVIADAMSYVASRNK